jgi:transposase InsO family protein
MPGSRKVVGWSMANHLRTELVLDALEMAIGQRRPDGVIHHSDQGSQFHRRLVQPGAARCRQRIRNRRFCHGTARQSGEPTCRPEPEWTPRGNRRPHHPQPGYAISQRIRKARRRKLHLMTNQYYVLRDYPLPA